MQWDSASLPFHPVLQPPEKHTEPDLKRGKRANDFHAIMPAVNYTVGPFNAVCPRFLKYESPRTVNHVRLLANHAAGRVGCFRKTISAAALSDGRATRRIGTYIKRTAKQLSVFY